MQSETTTDPNAPENEKQSQTNENGVIQRSDDYTNSADGEIKEEESATKSDNVARQESENRSACTDGPDGDSDISAETATRTVDGGYASQSSSIETECDEAVKSDSNSNCGQINGRDNQPNSISNVTPKNFSSENIDKSRKSFAKNFRECFRVAACLLLTHFNNVFILILLLIALSNVCLLNIPLVIIVTVIAKLKRRRSQIILIIVSAKYCAAIMLLKIITVGDNIGSIANCTPQKLSEMNTPLKYAFGDFQKYHFVVPLLLTIVVIIILLSASWIQSVVKEWKESIVLMEQSNFTDTGTSFAAFAKLLVSHGFHLFGYEACLIAMVLAVSIRMDFFSIFTLIWISVSLFSKGSALRGKIWTVCVYLQIVLICVQYLLAVGLPPSACIDYPWTDFMSKWVDSLSISIWFYLPIYNMPTNVWYILPDTIVLMFANRVSVVFDIKNRISKKDIKSIPIKVVRLEESRGKNIQDSLKLPDKDDRKFGFTFQVKQPFDILKLFVFKYGYWFTFITMVMAGVANASPTSFGYFAISSIVLLRGKEIFRCNYNCKGIRLTILKFIEPRIWRLALINCIFIMSLKVLLQLAGCAFVSYMNHICWFRQIFNIVCLDESFDEWTRAYPINPLDNYQKCIVNELAASLTLDCLCFITILFQIRIVKTSFFHHCMLQFIIDDELKERGSKLGKRRLAYLLDQQNLALAYEKMMATKKIRQLIQEQNTTYSPKSYGHSKRGGEYLLEPAKPLQQSAKSDLSLNSAGSFHSDEQSDRKDKSKAMGWNDGVKWLSNEVLKGVPDRIAKELMWWSCDHRFVREALQEDARQMQKQIKKIALTTTNDTRPLTDEQRSTKKLTQMQINNAILNEIIKQWKEKHSKYLENIKKDNKRENEKRCEQSSLQSLKQQQAANQSALKKATRNLKAAKVELAITKIQKEVDANTTICVATKTTRTNARVQASLDAAGTTIKILKVNEKKKSLAAVKTATRSDGTAAVEETTPTPGRTTSPKPTASDRILPSRTIIIATAPIAAATAGTSTTTKTVTRKMEAKPYFNESNVHFKLSVKLPTDIKNRSEEIKDLEIEAKRLKECETIFLARRSASRVQKVLLFAQGKMEEIRNLNLKLEKTKPLDNKKVSESVQNKIDEIISIVKITEVIIPPLLSNVRALSLKLKTFAVKRLKTAHLMPNITTENANENNIENKKTRKKMRLIQRNEKKLYEIFQKLTNYIKPIKSESTPIHQDPSSELEHKNTLISLLNSASLFASNIDTLKKLKCPAEINSLEDKQRNVRQSKLNNLQEEIFPQERDDIKNTRNEPNTSPIQTRCCEGVAQSRSYSEPTDTTESTDKIKKRLDDQTDALEELLKFLDMEEKNFEREQMKLPLQSGCTAVCKAFGHLLLAHLHAFCYLLIVIDHAASAALITLPLLIMTFCWGALSPLRPTKRFWQAIIFCTWAVIIIQFVFHFDCYPWNYANGNAVTNIAPTYLPSVIGVHQTAINTIIHIILLVLLCLHREQLQKFGLWDEEESATKEQSDSPNQSDGDSPQKKNSILEILNINANSISHQGDQASLHSWFVSPTGLNGNDFAQGNNSSRASFTEEQACEQTNGVQEEIQAASGAHHANKTHTEVQTDKFDPKRNIFEKTIDTIAAFYRDVLNKETPRYALDFFPLMLICYLCILIQVTIWYSDFGIVGNGLIVLSIAINDLSYLYVVTVAVIFILLIVDRAFYNEKSPTLRFVFHLFLFFFINFYSMVIIPWLSGRSLASSYTAMCFNIIFGIYMIASAAQVRHGYPNHRMSLFMRPENQLSRQAFMTYMSIPFVFEIVTFLEFACSNTRLSYRDFFTLETIFARAYELKCIRHEDKDYYEVKEKRSFITKMMVSVVILSFVTMFLLFPLILYSFNNVYGTNLPPDRVTIEIDIDGYTTLYQMKAEGSDELKPVDSTDYDFILNKFNTPINSEDKRQVEVFQQSWRFVNGYPQSQVVKLLFKPRSATYWDITEDNRAAMVSQLRMDTSLRLNFYIRIRRERGVMDTSIIEQDRVWHVDLSANITKEFADVINGTSNSSIILKKVWPPYQILPELGAIRVSPQLSKAMNEYKLGNVDLEMRLNRNSKMQEAWSVKMVSSSSTMVLNSNLMPGSGEEYFQQVVFVDKVVPDWINIGPIKNGIYAIFAGIVLIFWYKMRNYLVRSPLELMISEIPNVEPLYNKCMEIYMVRSAQPFLNSYYQLEVQMYAQLVHLFRSPSHLIELTRPT